MKSVSAIEAKFLRSKTHSSCTKLWKDITENEKENIFSNLNLGLNEVPVLYYDSTSYWWVLTNQRLIIYDSKGLNYFSLSEIKQIDLEEIFTKEKTKEDSTIINLKISNEVVNFHVEKGTWPIIYEILKFVSNQ